ncbi:MAG TPA: SdrD B-like domain-containing protein, partial [Pirellulaceae bacterium]|nr:SdrD B-like domain-containing protein [Pirellulaceae bacterium]
ATVAALERRPVGAVVNVVSVADASGNYQFTNLLLDESYNSVGVVRPTFVVSSATPEGFTRSPRNQGGNAAIDSDNQAGQSVSLVQGESNDTIDFGFMGTSSLGDFVWLDANGDGLAGQGEPGLSRVALSLTYLGLDNRAGTADDQTFTSNSGLNGEYLFEHLPGGFYRVQVGPATLPTGVTLTTHNEPTYMYLPIDSAVTTVDYGYRGPGRIDGSIFRDSNRDGSPSSGEGFANVIVNVTADIDGDGVDEVVTVRTDSQGNYTVPGLPVNNGSGGGITYKIRIDAASLPPGLMAVVDPDLLLDSTAQTTLSPLQPAASGVNFGYLGSGKTSGAVFADNNRDNRIGPTEPGIAKVTVMLTGVDVTGTNVTRVVQTGVDGVFYFDDLLPGVYKLVESQPEGYGDWFDRAGSEGGRASNDMIRDIVLTAGAHAQGYTFGEIDPLTVSKRDFLSPPYYSNPNDQFDVDADGFVAPIDALLVVNAINELTSSFKSSVSNSLQRPYFLDVNADSQLTPQDVLAVVNRLNQLSNLGAGEGDESQAAAALAVEVAAVSVAAIDDVLHEDAMHHDAMIDDAMVDDAMVDKAVIDDSTIVAPAALPTLQKPLAVALLSPVDAAELIVISSRSAGDDSDSVFGDDELLDDLLACVPAGKPLV